jgi:hypothetical protein
MPQIVEINLRLPSLRMKAPGSDEAKVVDNSGMRFCKRVELQTIPKAGDALEMSAGTLSFSCEVVQVNWHESKDIFVVACKYGKPRVLPEDYVAISTAPDWEGRPLL